MAKGTRRRKPLSPKTIDLTANEVKAADESSDLSEIQKENADLTNIESAENRDGLSAAAKDEAMQDDKSPEPAKPASKNSFGGLLISALLGGGVALAGAGISGYLPFGGSTGLDSVSQSLATAEEKIATLSAQVEKLSQSGGGEIPAALTDRITSLESNLEAVKAASESSDAQSTALGETVTAVQKAEKLAEGANQKADDALAQVSELNQKILTAGGSVDSETIKAALASETSAMNERLQALESKAGEIGASPEVKQQIEVISSQLADITKQIEVISPVAEQVVGLDNQITAMGGRIDGVEQKIQNDVMAPMAKVQEAASAAIAGQKVARSVSARALLSALEQGGAFTSELAAAEALLGENETISRLKQFAAAGVPTAAQLASGFANVADAISALQEVPAEDAGILAKFMNNAKSLVKVRPAGPQEGDNAVAIASRVEAFLKSGDLQKANSEWDSLPENAKAISADWKKQMDTHIEAQDLVAKLVEALSSENKS